MKKMLLLVFVFVVSFGYAQQYSFASTNTIIIDKWKYLDLLNKTPKPEIVYKLENGASYSKKYFDSIIKTKNSYKLKTIYLADTTSNVLTLVLKTRTDDELKNDNQAFFDLQKKDKKNRTKLLGSQVANLKFMDIAGQEYTSETMLGKMVVINFWFTKCAPCIKEMPDLNKLSKKHGSEKVLYFAITYDQTELVQNFLSKQQLDFIVIPNQQKTIDYFGVNFFPTNILLDQQGKVVFVNELFNPKSNNGINEIDKLIKKYTN